MDVYEYVWMCMDAYEKCSCVRVCVCVWMDMDVYGCVCMSVDVYGRV
jgi:hypothetical protein